MSESKSNAKTIGAMNGGWQFIFKVHLAIMPLVVLWISWASVAIIQMQSNRWTVEGHIRYAEKIEAQFKQYPPATLLNRVTNIEADLTTIKVALARIEQKLE